MSRTIRRKGWHVTTSSKWHDQKNNEFAYIKRYTEYVKTKKDKEHQQKYVDKQIAQNMERPLELASMMKKRHRDSFILEDSALDTLCFTDSSCISQDGNQTLVEKRYGL